MSIDYIEIISDAIDSIENHNCPMCGCEDTYYVSETLLECNVCGEVFTEGGTIIKPEGKEAA